MPSPRADGSVTDDSARALLATVAEWVWETDAAFRLSYISDSFLEATGFDHDELIGCTWSELGFAAASADDELTIAACLADCKPFRAMDTVGVLPDGRRLWSRTSGYPVFDGDGRFTGYRGASTDITELYEAQQALRASEARFRGFTSAAGDWFWETDADFHLTYISEGITAATGLAPQQLIGRNRPELGIAAGNTDDEREVKRRVAARKPYRDIVSTFNAPNGRRVWVRSSAVPFFDETGAYLGYRGTSTDVSELHAAQQALRESQQRFEDFAEAASDWFWEMGPDLRVTYMSDDMVRQTGLDTAWHMGSARRDGDDLQGDDAVWSRHLDDLQNARPFRGFELCRRRLDGSTQWFSISGKPLFSPSDEFLGYRGVAADISERKLAQLRSQELAAIVERSDDVVVTVAHDGTITSWNDAAERNYGYTAAQAIGRHMNIVVGDARLARQQAKMLERVLDGEALRDIVTERTGKDGARLIVSLTMSPVRGADGQIVGVASVARNVTAFKEVEAALRDSNQRLQAVLNTITEGIITIDEHGVIASANPAAQALFGYGAEEMIGRRVKMLMPEKGVRYQNRYLNRFLRTVDGEVSGVRREVEGRRADGTAFPAEVAFSEFTAEGHRMLAGVVRDISERKHAEASLQAFNERLKAVLDTVVDGIITIDRYGKIHSANPAVEHLFGYSQRRLIGKYVKMLMPKDVARQHDRYVNDYLHTGEAKIIGIGREVEGRRADGTTFPVELAVSEFTADGGRMFAGVLRDISERKRAETSLQAFTERLKAVLDTVVDGIITIDRRGIIHTVNPAVERLFGYEQRQLIGSNVKMLMPEDVAHQHDQYVDNYVQTGEAKIIGIGREVEGRRADGSIFPAELAVTEFIADGERMFAGVLRDISERKQAEARLQELAVTDPLTGAFNRRYFEEQAEAALRRARRSGQPLSLVLLDGDRFKTVNDTYGHQAGDEVLKAIVAVCQEAVRDVDIVARFGGEEFAVLLHDTPIDGAQLTAERLRRQVAKLKVYWDGEEIAVSISLGVAATNGPVARIETLIAAADRALYAAKEGGRNRVVVSADAGDEQIDA